MNIMAANVWELQRQEARQKDGRISDWQVPTMFINTASTENRVRKNAGSEILPRILQNKLNQSRQMLKERRYLRWLLMKTTNHDQYMTECKYYHGKHTRIPQSRRTTKKRCFCRSVQRNMPKKNRNLVT